MQQEIRLINAHGERLYLTRTEREQFGEASLSAKRNEKALCLILYYTGCRISEALSITPKHIDLVNKSLTIRTLKKRRVEHRIIPVPDSLINDLNNIYGITEIKKSSELKQPIIPWKRRNSYNVIIKVMERAGLKPGAYRCPKGLRHGFAIAALTCTPPVDLVTLRDLMGHASIETTACYCKVLGWEKRNIVSRMW